MFIPAVRLTKNDRKRLGQLAAPYFGQADCSALANTAASMFARYAPWADIRVAHVPSPAQLADTQIRLAVFVDFRPDQGIFLTKGESDE